MGATADAGGLDLRLGWYFPSAQSNLFEDVFSLYTKGAAFGVTSPPGIQSSEWDSFTGGIEYNHKVANNVELAVSVDGYSKTLDTSYRDYVRGDDSPIQQTLRLSIVPIGLSLRLVPTSRSARLAPFVVVGVDAMVYEYEEFGDFVDFFDPRPEIIADSFASQRRRLRLPRRRRPARLGQRRLRDRRGGALLLEQDPDGRGFQPERDRPRGPRGHDRFPRQVLKHRPDRADFLLYSLPFGWPMRRPVAATSLLVTLCPCSIRAC